ncbi:MAG: hypothetical protein M3R25_06625 [Bacteroidota bacterium]|nr:hypothetical protein [Bacteroidota bacterium]
MNSRFLFFLYYYPPLPGTPAKRNFRIASEVSKRTSYTKIFTATAQPEGQKSDPNVQIETLPTYDYRAYLRKKTEDGALPEKVKNHWWVQMGIKLINTFPFNLIIGEGGLIYYKNLLRKGRKEIEEQKITHLYSSYRPFADHYAAYKLKKQFPHLIWIADFRDLIIDPHYNHIFFKSGHHLFFKRVFRKANYLTTVSDGLARQLERYNSDVITLRNGIKNVPDQIEPTHCKYFKIAYTGSMFLDKRNAEPLFAAIRELINQHLMSEDYVRIIYAGKDSDIWQKLASKFELDAILVDKGIVSDKEATLIQREACINVLLTISSDKLEGVLTGKMIEYFESGSPVLGIVVGRNDSELSNILKELEIGKSFSDQDIDHSAIKDFIYKEYQYYKTTGMNRKPVNIDVLKSKYSSEAVMRNFLEKIHLNK